MWYLSFEIAHFRTRFANERGRLGTRSSRNLWKCDKICRERLTFVLSQAADAARYPTLVASANLPRFVLCVTRVCSPMDILTPPSVTPPIARLPLFLLPLLQAVATVVAAVVLLHMSAHQVRRTTNTEHRNHTLCCDECLRTDGRFHTAVCDAADYNLNASPSSTVSAPVGTNNKSDFVPGWHR